MYKILSHLSFSLQWNLGGFFNFGLSNNAQVQDQVQFYTHFPQTRQPTSGVEGENMFNIPLVEVITLSILTGAIALSITKELLSVVYNLYKAISFAPNASTDNTSIDRV